VSESVKQILLALMRVGAQSIESAVEKKEIIERVNLEEEELDSKINNLINEGYMKIERNNNEARIYLTPLGIVAASSIYS
jgi:predicted transcriptional regulator